MCRRLLIQPRTSKRARPSRAAPAPGRGLATRPRSSCYLSAVVDVDVDLAGDVDVRGVAEAQLTPEDVQQHQNDNDQQDDGEDSATATAASFDNGRAFAVHIVAIVGHWKLSLSRLLLW